MAAVMGLNLNVRWTVFTMSDSLKTKPVNWWKSAATLENLFVQVRCADPNASK
jgi:hypothetical protein